jgi:hypothetical protein
VDGGAVRRGAPGLRIRRMDAELRVRIPVGDRTLVRPLGEEEARRARLVPRRRGVSARGAGGPRTAASPCSTCGARR